MPDKNNIWYKAFNNPELKEEKWLEPSDALFAHISDEVYGKKKKRRRLAYWIFGLSTFLGLLVISWLFMDTNQSQPFSSLEDTEKTRQTVLLKTQENDLASKTEDYTASNKVVSNIESKKINQSKNNISSIIGNSVNGTESSYSRIKNNNIESSSDHFLSSQQLRNTSVKSDIILETGLNNPISESGESRLRKTSKDNFSNKNILHINVLPKAFLATLLIERDVNFDFMVMPLEIRNQNKIISKNMIGLTIGLSQWEFDLNNSYASALNPADFDFNDGNGWNTGFLYKRELSEKWHFSTLAQIEKIRSNSGHNSSVDYNPDQEINGNMSNELNLMMASPFGFLESNLVINRGSDAGLDNLDLVLDLHNEHEITNLSWQIGIDYQLLTSSFVNIGATSNIGLNYFSAVTNDLSSFDIDREGFVSGSTMINRDQQNINTVTPFVDLGITLNRSLFKNMNTGFIFNYRKTMSPIYSEGDFSTTLSAYNLRWVVSRSF